MADDDGLHAARRMHSAAGCASDASGVEAALFRPKAERAAFARAYFPVGTSGLSVGESRLYTMRCRRSAENPHSISAATASVAIPSPHAAAAIQ